MRISRVRTNVVLPAAGLRIVNMKLKLPRFNQLKIQLFGLLSFLLWASSDRNQTSWKFHLQKLRMGQRFGQCDFIILFGILTSSTPIWFRTIIN